MTNLDRRFQTGFEGVDRAAEPGLVMEGDVATLVKPDGTREPVNAGGGSQPVVGRPKNGSTVYPGLPPSTSIGDSWSGITTGGAGTPVADRLYLAPLYISEAIIVTSLHLTDGLQSGDVNVRAVISAADEDWQPTGPVLFQDTVLIPAASNEFDDFPFTGLSLALSPGMYLFGFEADDDTFILDCRPASFPGAVHCDPSQESGQGSPMITGFTAPHVYAPFVGTLPAWDTAVINLGEQGRIIYPMTMKWDPA